MTTQGRPKAHLAAEVPLGKEVCNSLCMLSSGRSQALRVELRVAARGRIPHLGDRKVHQHLWT